ncbi:unnamed protein product [Periconia digitata]|uniref:Uncharacterized protein n=1 Tax=Periconia digitata TaxID=1303443 RepID=A0A9W4USU6_9PLEO|nr:unnamed protein product [Periconia digitata]
MQRDGQWKPDADADAPAVQRQEGTAGTARDNTTHHKSTALNTVISLPIDQLLLIFYEMRDSKL